MKVIYLDFDGVIFTQKEYQMLDGSISEVNLTIAKKLANVEACRRVKYLLDFFSAEVVISSSWKRFGFDFCDAVLRAVVDPEINIIGETPTKMSATRHVEITLDIAWRKLNIADIIILDDDVDLFYAERAIRARWVRTLFEEGFTEACLQKALAL